MEEDISFIEVVQRQNHIDHINFIEELFDQEHQQYLDDDYDVDHPLDIVSNAKFKYK